MFQLHPQLQKDTIALCQLELCCVLLMNDANYPWFILVPQRENIQEIYQLSAVDQQLLIQESSWLAQVLVSDFKPDKLNIAALGNIVPQLHLHHIVRYNTDPAWPSPVWEKIPAVPYSQQQILVLKQKIKDKLFKS